ncbi:hypothetical protein PybrP1_008566 [[Pythium] brassicae (nom. inval.)]|nr:hypothetical protein PybrP1_008566 [[Pythium] brassicae (nom. inval.)]
MLRRLRVLPLPRRPALSRALSIPATNPLLECIRARTLPPFAQLQVAHLAPAVETAVDELARDLNALEARVMAADKAPLWRELAEPLELQSDPLARLWGVAGHLLSVRNSPELRAAHDSLQPRVVSAFTAMAQSRALFDAFQAVRAGDEWGTLSLAQQRVVELSLRSAALSGVGLIGAEKERFNQLKLRVAELSTKFSSNLLDATKAFVVIVTDKPELEGLPDSLLQLFSQSAREEGHENSTPEAGPWRVTLDPPSYVQFMKYATNRALRESLYRASSTRASTAPFDNEEIIKEILAIRKEMAQLLGFQTYAQVSISKKMAPSVAEVEKMHDDLRAKCAEMATREIATLAEYARTHGQTDELAPWDLSYWAEKLKAEKFLFSDEVIKPYFPLEKVLDGLFALTSRLFGVTIKAADGQAEVWNKDVRFFNVCGSDGEVVASFYLDPFSRPKEKNGGAWMNVCVDRSRLLGPPERGGVRNPVAYLICNQSPPVGDTPSLMTFREVETLFHEFGHGLQHMLTTVEHGAVAGINGIEWDAVELPSQMMENFCYDPETIVSISGHYQTGEPLPMDLFEKIKAARNYMVATMMLRQLGFGALDMYLHEHYTGDEPIFEVQKRILAKFSVLEPLAEDRFLCSFSHIFAGGYAAGYYSYKWAEILSCDAFGAFEEAKDPEAAARVGRRFRDTVLARGGGQHPLEVFEAFRGRKPSVAPLLLQYGLQGVDVEATA